MVSSWRPVCCAVACAPLYAVSGLGKEWDCKSTDTRFICWPRCCAIGKLLSIPVSMLLVGSIKFWGMKADWALLLTVGLQIEYQCGAHVASRLLLSSIPVAALLSIQLILLANPAALKYQSVWFCVTVFRSMVKFRFVPYYQVTKMWIWLPKFCIDLLL